MKDTAVVICNFNKKDFVKKNIQSLMRQNTNNFDIYVVDNASTDGTVEEIQDEFGNDIIIINNTVNLGGSGGFNTGIKVAMKKDYTYIVLLDNDVELKEDCIRTLYTDMVSHHDIGIMGAKILKMDYPNIIQEFAPSINYESLTFELNYGGDQDDGTLPHLADCDYVPACALIVRREVIEAIGCLPEENFIYYDDIIWGVRCHRAGYRVVANSYAVVWHKGGASINPTTFVSYYLNRNKYRFFMIYMSTEDKENVTDAQVEERVERILLDVYEGIHSCQYDGRYNMAKTRMDAFLDALEGISGRAKAYEIRQREIPEEKFEKLLKEAKNILIHMNGYWENTRRILYHIYVKEQEWGKEFHVELLGNAEYEKCRMLGIDICNRPLYKEDEYDLVFHVCSHIYELEIDCVNYMWIDGWRNVLADGVDFEYYKLFHARYQTFKLCFEDRIREYIKKAIREGKDG